MSIKSVFSSKSVLDFFYMFSSNIVKKGFGFIERDVASFLGLQFYMQIFYY